MVSRQGLACFFSSCDCNWLNELKNECGRGRLLQSRNTNLGGNIRTNLSGLLRLLPDIKLNVAALTPYLLSKVLRFSPQGFLLRFHFQSEGSTLIFHLRVRLQFSIWGFHFNFQSEGSTSISNLRVRFHFKSERVWLQSLTWGGFHFHFQSEEGSTLIFNLRRIRLPFSIWGFDFNQAVYGLR